MKNIREVMDRDRSQGQEGVEGEEADSQSCLKETIFSLSVLTLNPKRNICHWGTPGGKNFCPSFHLSHTSSQDRFQKARLAHS
jgi:hypothetical protein